MGGLATIVVLLLGSVFGPFLLPFDDTHIDIMQRFAPPFSGAHVLGTDELGRDILARLMMGGRISLSIGIVAMAIAMAIGILVGTIAGFYGGWLGAILMRFVDAVLCFPAIFLLLALAALVEPGILSTTLLIAATAWMNVARIVEAQIRSLRERDFAVAAKAFGSSDIRIMFRELVPNAMAPIVVAATLNVAKADPARILCQLPRLRHPAASSELGQHAEQRADLSDQRAMARHHSRSRHHAGRDQLQTSWATACVMRWILAWTSSDHAVRSCHPSAGPGHVRPVSPPVRPVRLGASDVTAPQSHRQR